MTITASTKRPKVGRRETNTSRFGRVITYTARIDGVTFSAERMVGLTDDYTVSSYIGRCGMSGQYNLGTVTGGRGVAERFAELAVDLYDQRAFVKPDVKREGFRTHAELCCDKDECGRWSA